MLRTSRNRFPWLLLLLALAAVCVALNRQSFWTDETETALKAAAPTVHSWWARLYGEHDSNLQVPFYMMYVWVWARVFPVSELSMRAANVPWFLLGFYAVAHYLRRRPGLRNAALLVYAIHPFVWYYLNEARPYMMQLSAALLVSGVLFRTLDGPEEALGPGWWWTYGAGITILCGSNLLGIPWAISITVLLLWHAPFRRSLFVAGRAAVLTYGAVLACMAVYYAWTIREGAGPGDTDMSYKSLPFVFYEQFGFAGYGPGRDAMRGRQWSVFVPYIRGYCVLVAPLLYALARAAAARFGLPRGKLAPIALAVAAPLAFVFGLGFAKHFLVLGRHLMPLFPFVLGALAFAICHLWERRRLLDRAVVALLVLALAASALEYRFARRHEKDDNRDAASISRAALADGDDVWWGADSDCAMYYGLPIVLEPHSGAALLLWKPKLQWLAGLPEPSLIVLSKPDIFDANGAIQQYIQDHGYVETQRLPAFTFWTKKAPG